MEYPEVLISRGGFDAFVGNPPFMGGSFISGNLGNEYREHLVKHLARGKRGNADLCAYFFLRAEELLRENGQTGLLGTNTIAQEDTREVGLEQLAARGSVIARAVPSRKWPGTANLEVAHVWVRKGKWVSPFVLEEIPVRGITPYLSEVGAVKGQPHRLRANALKSFNGSKVYGQGFVLEPEEAERLIARDPRNKAVLFPTSSAKMLTRDPTSHRRVG